MVVYNYRLQEKYDLTGLKVVLVMYVTFYFYFFLQQAMNFLALMFLIPCMMQDAILQLVKTQMQFKDENNGV